MATIIWKDSKGTSKSRYKKKRAIVVAERRQAEEMAKEFIKAENGLVGCSGNLTKALLIPTVAKDLSLPQDPKDDAMDHKVNHAHQRRPDKKWS